VASRPSFGRTHLVPPRLRGIQVRKQAEGLQK